MTETAEKKVVKVEFHNAKLHFGRLTSDAALKRNIHFADIPPGVPFEVAMRSNYWAHHVRTLRPLDRIEMMAEDGSWEAEARVMFVGQAEVKLSELFYKDHGSSGVEDVKDQNYAVKWKGPVAKFCVVNVETGDVIKNKMYPQSEAVDFLKRYVQRMKQ